MRSEDQKETLMIAKQAICKRTVERKTSLTPDWVVDVTGSILKGSNQVHVRQLTQSLLKHYFPRLPDRYIAELTHCKDAANIRRNVNKLQSDVLLMEVFTDLKSIFDTK